ncbi:UNKNOWN [Stylonychia lemnae]|uniref:SIS domain-containing protein n=1 Tax=Stylonychia lemnae TaxID=5949 RepID=A0A078AE73_STYLE|nr:UNKNOWN [Stylonychia lemnae]|eukprot:CDW79218.1 UNKNOWN [Stylonychia lemnae]
MESQQNKILDILQIQQSSESVDYVNNQTQFQLHGLLTEQRHEQTQNLSQTLKKDTKEGLNQLFSVDEDISQRFSRLGQNDDLAKLQQAADSVYNTLINGRKIYIYGCGATGRLAKQIECEMWKRFYDILENNEIVNPKLKDRFPSISLRNQVIGELTGGDRALVSSLEGFEDLQVIGHLQYEDNQISKGDCVFSVTEGGETSSVIGTILYAAQQYGDINQLSEDQVLEAQRHLYYIYNNNDEHLTPFDRCNSVLNNKLITKISLCTGQQAIGGSTRMQASTTSQFIVSMLLENAMHRILSELLDQGELNDAGFQVGQMSLSDQIISFTKVQSQIKNHINDIAKFTELEYNTYANGGRTYYFAQHAIVTIFTDMTERSPTFSLAPIDRSDAKEVKSIAQVFTNVDNQSEAWVRLLGRNYRGLSHPNYREKFEDVGILRQKALDSLAQAGPDQEQYYDFSFSKDNREFSLPTSKDLGVLVLFGYEIERLIMHYNNGIPISDENNYKNKSKYDTFIREQMYKECQILHVNIGDVQDPMYIRHSIALKMIMNAHSTAVNTKFGKVVGNTMSNVRAGNLKLVGRATYLTLSHVNQNLKKMNESTQITYSEANAVLFDVMDYLSKNPKITAESPVPTSIIRILEAMKKQTHITNEEAFVIKQELGLADYLENYA